MIHPAALVDPGAQLADDVEVGAFSIIDAKVRIDAGTLAQVIAVPRRAVRDNRRVWVVDDDGRLQVRDAAVAWESEQTLLLERRSLRDGDQVVVSRIAGLVPGASVRSRQVDPATGRVIERASVAGRE